MDIKSLRENIKKEQLEDLFNLVKPVFIFRTDLNLNSFEVEEKHEMRIDLIFQDMYDLDSTQIGLYLENVDVILFINSIDNPLNVKKGTILFYPSIDEIDSYRLQEDEFEMKNKNIDKLIVPNKASRKDSNRQKFLEQNTQTFSPVMRKAPRNSIEIKNGVFNIGGL